jgi:mRNA interferase MazF
MRRGDIVLVRVPYLDGTAHRRRPALIVQDDRLNRGLSHTVIAAISSNISRAAQPEKLLIDPNHPDWVASGLRLPSVVRCERLFTIEQADVDRVLGRLSNATMLQIDACLKAALGIV